MTQLIQIQTLEQLQGISDLAGLPPLSPQSFLHHAPDCHWVLRNGDAITAYCSLWWRDTPDYSEQKLGLVGHYAVQDATSAHPLIDRACEQLATQGCTMAVAPIDGNTWRRYRLLTERGTEPAFFLEPDNPEDWAAPFRAQGFTPLAEYSSALNSDLSQQDPRLEKVAARLEKLGLKIRSLNLQTYETELQRLYELSIVSFRHNFLYSPIASTEFVMQYSQIKPYIQPELVLLAEHENKLVGFLFAIPDLLQAKHGEAIDTVIIKTVAVLPGRTYAGLGNLLVAKSQAIAHQLGYRRAIHALMHDQNNSRNLSDRYAQTIRRYTLFAKLLGEEKTC
jgi:GNAT superfamily N-acetyltransferase